MRWVEAIATGLSLWLLASGAQSNPAAETEPLVIATWGGAYEAVQQAVLFEPFTRKTGIPIKTRAYNGGLAILEESPPDLVDMGMSQAIAACDRGLLRPLDHRDLPPGAAGTPASEDFIQGAFRRCSLTHSLYATVIAYNRRALGGRRPEEVADFFDLEAFPGPRALQATPAGNLEWALMSYGVPRRQLYDLLSTPRGLRLALARLERLQGRLRWWREGREPVRLLESGEVVMATGYNGRFFNARLKPDSPIEILWDGQIQEHQTWVMPAAGQQPKQAWRFIRFATRTRPQRHIAERLAYGPSRQSATARIGRHPETGMDMRAHIPTHKLNARRALVKDVNWWARTRERVTQAFERWRSRLESGTEGQPEP